MNPSLSSTQYLRGTRGFTLVEILIALVLTAFVIGGVAQVFLSGKAAYMEMQRFGQLQAEMRYLSDFLTRDIRGADIVSGALNELTVTRTAGSDGDRDCLGNPKNESDEIQNIYSVQGDALSCGGENLVGGTEGPIRVITVDFQPLDGEMKPVLWTGPIRGIEVSVFMESGLPQARRPHDFSFVVGLRNAIISAYNNPGN